MKFEKRDNFHFFILLKVIYIYTIYVTRKKRGSQKREHFDIILFWFYLIGIYPYLLFFFFITNIFTNIFFSNKIHSNKELFFNIHGNKRKRARLGTGRAHWL